ncbi:MAG: nicotinate-nucleotide adenylyltransferase [Burkholderiales bacterium]|jgi:nicotinate-nucleotide adenylyltransferase|uniref:Probable nicotinate-nucleotide adenylyltransferase n=1 Tax=Candidatus Desulfobacillus denitrificans TaxID=2608985 RepID=A0A809QVK6_9PROT|nr:nicotinate-nucleotide adenylyltransferase [Zoogloeaceae bacterium]MBP9652823.1 nicotinate-nucleotide adenylyltransferase [Rhodocyclaceae bacterium]MCZ2173621.1 nicotinate-nucleotide adenylyltransferase [Burkholderiales bacterium]OQY74147.1 MAG: nicotinic acid mononucleotide adenylyltransferase [Rhodocyclaceae bacterium UTPRO2]BBO19449.1 nicotinic acid mononucleotide adenylyltransferase [Candidatus Desulfobacillus denitrificans]GIK45371.1 MAG: putative nicotinate-nucleotide adenylyltransfera
MPEPLGLIGGTFDPVHYGHLRLAEEAREALGLDEVRWIPAGRPPHRAAPRVAAAHRLEMVRRAVAGNRAFTVDDAETRSDAPSYTASTLERLRAGMPARPLVLLLGADAFLGLAGWHRWRELFALAHFGVASRPGFALSAEDLPAELAAACAGRLGDDAAALHEAPAGRVVRFPMTPLAISASLLRAQLAAGTSVRYLLPDHVREYIQLHHLYGMPDGR